MKHFIWCGIQIIYLDKNHKQLGLYKYFWL